MKTAVITGASGGIGFAIGQKLAALGYQTVLAYNSTPCEDLENSFAVKCDVSDFESVENLYNIALEKLGHIDLVVNRAGVAHTDLVQDMSRRQINRVVQTDLTGTIFSCKFAGRIMARQHFGNIINIASVWGVCGASCEAVYSRAKGGIIAFTKALAKELAPCKVRVNCISPGVIKTKMLDCYTRRELEDLAGETPLERLGLPADIAETAAFLAGESSSFITGQNIVVDGGFIL